MGKLEEKGVETPRRRVERVGQVPTRDSFEKGDPMEGGIFNSENREAGNVLRRGPGVLGRAERELAGKLATVKKGRGK